MSHELFSTATRDAVCKADRLAYPIRDGIPVMLDEEARSLTAEEVDALRK